jgi:threonine/homoserine/homoserine lactone efflux protein
MGEVIGQILTPAVGVALSPFPIVGVILMLLSPKARINGPAFLAGWLAGMAILLALILIFANPSDLSDSDDAPSTLAGLIDLALGVLLVLLAIKQWKSRPKGGEEPQMPKWMAGIDKVTPAKALVLGAFLSAINPKNLLLTIAAGTSIAAADLSTTDQIVAALVFMVIASVSVGGLVIWYMVAGESAKGKLDSLRGWLVAHNNIIMCVLFLLIGVNLIGKALPAFF